MSAEPHTGTDTGRAETLLERKARIEVETAERIAILLKERNQVLDTIVRQQARNAEISAELKELGYVHKRGPKSKSAEAEQ